MLILVKMALSSSDKGANILTISDFWDPPSRPSYMGVAAGGHLGHVTSIMSSDFHFLVPESFLTKFGSEWLSSF